MSIAKLKQTILKKDVLKDIIGQYKAKQQIKSAILADRNVVIIGKPGVGKTTIAKNVAALMPKIKEGKKEKLNFVRIQGSPDLTAEDLLGDIDPIKALKYGPLSVEAFTKGKLFKADNGVLFFDELNRCPEKLQNALLQVLQEKIVTIGSYDIDFDVNFIFIATMNPQDSSTEKVSDVLLDRLDVVYMDYPETFEIEKEIVLINGKNLDVEFPDNLLNFCVDFVRNIRDNKNLEKTPSVRATLGLYERSQSIALLKNKDKVGYKDIEEIIESVIAHRVKLKPSIKYLKNAKEFLREELDKFLQNKKYSSLNTPSSEKEGDP